MKKILLTICMAGSSFLAFSQAFIPGNLVVIRSGSRGVELDGTASVTSTNAQPVFIDEYNITGQLVRSIPFPTSTGGGNNRFVLANRSTSEQEGNVSLSSNGSYLSLIGYDTELNTTGVRANTDINIVPAIINANGVISTPLSLSRGDITDGGARSSVTSDGSNIWFIGGKGGIFHTQTSGSVVTKVSTTSGRYISIYNGQLYATSTASGTFRFRKIGTGIPITPISSTESTELPGIIDDVVNKPTNPNAFVFFDTDGDDKADLLYLSNDEVTQGLQKYILVEGIWVHKGNLTIENYPNNQLRGLTGNYIIGQGAVLYGTTSGYLLKITDTSAPSENISGTIMFLAEAPDNTIFRGVSLTPGSTPGVLPVTLTSFNSKKVGNHVQLNWTTSSEKDNSHFEILRSGNGKEFNNIGNVKGTGNSNQEIKYSYTDYNPLAGVNYYKLKQVDLNGNSEESSVISETFQLGDAAFSIVVKENTIELLAYSEQLSEAEISITDISGKTIKNLNVPLVSGNNSLEIPVNNLQSGVYVVALSSNGQIKRVKFIK